ncbi:DNA damage-inducible transcript 3 protein [Tachyglossus aculeatus]|uniref:DNA damage-inducible transcript 3 protein n=1 Tax=Tachyglossus aculeatus TaxID=9261 RepID=UPI0018F2CEE0|nr:DNA damage-inducible transcript 3 protein [Tachyglossus aculeatus]
MAAEPLPFPSPLGPLAGWELEAWYEDLQELLSSDEAGTRPAPPSGAEQVERQPLTTVDVSPLAWAAAAAAEPGPSSSTNTDPGPSTARQDAQSTRAGRDDPSPPPAAAGEEGSPGWRWRQRQQQEEEEEKQQEPEGQGSRRRRRRWPRRQREAQGGPGTVAWLLEENARLKREIEWLSAEVERARRALIARVVSLPP